MVGSFSCKGTGSAEEEDSTSCLRRKEVFHRERDYWVSQARTTLCCNNVRDRRPRGGEMHCNRAVQRRLSVRPDNWAGQVRARVYG